MIRFNKPYLSGNELQYIRQAVEQGRLAGNGPFTQKCQSLFEQRFGFQKCLLTTSCTDALEMCAILVDVKPGDEVIVPSYTFVSTATSFLLRGAKIVFADSQHEHPNIDHNQLEALITKKTKAIVVVHYAGIACDMEKIMNLAKKYNLYVIEDAAQAIDSYYDGRPLGSIGDLSAFSFHETKNITSGEGGMLVVNNTTFNKRADIVWEKGTNRKAFFNGEIDKYGWVDIGSSFLPSELISAFLLAQLEQIEKIQHGRKKIWQQYLEELSPLEHEGHIRLPLIPEHATNNAHMFYILLNGETDRDSLIRHLKKNDINAVFHYQSLHKSPFFQPHHDGRELPMSDFYSKCLLRLPFYFELTEADQHKTISQIRLFFGRSTK